MPARIAVLGAPATGKTNLSQELAGCLRTRGHRVQVLAPGHPPQGAVADADLVIEDAPGPQHLEGCDLTLLMGLDLATAQGLPDHARSCQAADAHLRESLTQAGVSWRVIYGQGPERVRQALDAVAAVLPWAWAVAAREEDIGRWSRLRASCEKCGDAVCEHRLFTGGTLGLTAPRS
ncbi:MAG: hypothetical protein RIS88_2826 [Pseudomonadota bacterium]